MIRPPRGCWARITRNASRVHRKTPVRLTATTASHSANGTSSSSCAGAPLPALLKRRSTRPCRATAVSKSLRTSASSVTSVGTGSRTPGSSAPRCAIAASASGRRPASTTVQPSPASARAAAAPMPLPAPVTTAMRGAIWSIGPPVGRSDRGYHARAPTASSIARQGEPADVLPTAATGPLARRPGALPGPRGPRDRPAVRAVRPVQRGRGADRDRLPVGRGPGLVRRPPVPGVQRHPGEPAPEVGRRDRRRQRVPGTVEPRQREHPGRARSARHLRAPDPAGDPDRTRRLDHGAGGPV